MVPDRAVRALKRLLVWLVALAVVAVAVVAFYDGVPTGVSYSLPFGLDGALAGVTGGELRG